MEKSQFRVLIQHYFLRGKTISQTKTKLDKYYSDSALSYGMVQKWFTEFRCGCTSTETIPGPGRPNKITTPEMINKIHGIALNDPKVKVREIVEIVSISTEHMRSVRKVSGLPLYLRAITVVGKREKLAKSRSFSSTNLTFCIQEFFGSLITNLRLKFHFTKWLIQNGGQLFQNLLYFQ